MRRARAQPPLPPVDNAENSRRFPLALQDEKLGFCLQEKRYDCLGRRMTQVTFIGVLRC